MRCLTLLTLLYLFVPELQAQNDDITDSSLQIFEKPDTLASYTGGEQGWRTFLTHNLNPNVPVDNEAPYGKYTIIVQFIVNTDGSVTNIKALTNEGYGMEAEVVRMMHRSGQWIPARKDGKPVRSVRKQPVTFMTTEYGFDIITKTPFTLYTGIDNEVTLDIKDIRPALLDASISTGTLIKTSAGKFIARVPKPGRVLIKVFNVKKNTEIGAMSFEVKDPKDK